VLNNREAAQRMDFPSSEFEPAGQPHDTVLCYFLSRLPEHVGSFAHVNLQSDFVLLNPVAARRMLSTASNLLTPEDDHSPLSFQSSSRLPEIV
jgi:hypothetical protein